MKAHPIANIFPMMSDEEILSLSEDIKNKGLLEPIVTYEDKILDGRNRYKACIKANVSPRCIPFEGGNPADFVWSKNAERRHLEKSQLVMLKLENLKQSKDWEEKRDGANGKRSRAAKEQPRVPTGKGKQTVLGTGPIRPDGTCQDKRKIQSDAAYELADAAGVGATVAAQAIHIDKERPDLAKKVAEGEMSVTKADKIRREEKKTQKPKTEKPTNGFVGQEYLIRLDENYLEFFKVKKDIPKEEIIPTKEELSAVMKRLRNQLYTSGKVKI